jgi:hypothetical protein
MGEKAGSLLPPAVPILFQIRDSLAFPFKKLLQQADATI